LYWNDTPAHGDCDAIVGGGAAAAATDK